MVRILLAVFLTVSLAFPALANRAETLARGLAAADAGDWSAVRRAERQLSDQAARDTLTWLRLRARNGEFREYVDFLNRNADWPGLPLMARRGEARIPDSAAGDQIRAYFSNHAPQTGEGTLKLAEVERRRGNGRAADAMIVKAWREFVLGAETEAKFLNRHRALLADHHTARIDNLLWGGHTEAARRMLPLVDARWRSSSEARIALRENRDGVDALIEAVHPEFRNGAGLAYERYLWRLRKGRTASAMELMLERSPGGLGRPEEWGNRRRAMARDLMRDDRHAEAYRLASQHGLTTGRHYADLEWLSGYLSLRFLNQPARALQHFQNHRNDVASPISLGRAGYWEGRAYEAMGQQDQAIAAYQRAAQYQTSFYGQMASERAGLATDPANLGTETFPDWRQARFMQSSVLRAALFLQEAGDLDLAERFMVHLSETLTRTERGQLADLALSLGEPHIALRLAKYAAGEGQLLHKAYHPLDQSLLDRRLPVNGALALAIARRESEFDPNVVSPAGALGLMQLMPRTGAAMASDVGVSGFSTKRLIEEPALNIRLGSEYLSQQIADFGPGTALVATAYNAGPSRARNWTNRFGDPRSARTDIVDWIEHVPFRETRNYIMRVTESMLIYELLLAGEAKRLEPTKALRGR